MAYRFRRREPPLAGIARIVAGEIDGALADVADPAVPPAEKVHQARRRCKRIRAVLRLARAALGKAYRPENAWFRDSARLLSTTRDADSVIAAFDALVADAESGAFEAVGRSLRRRRDELERSTDVQGLLSAYVIRMKKAEQRVAGWSLDGDGFRALRNGLFATYAAARRGMQTAYGKDGDGASSSSAAAEVRFHEWRKHVKYHWFHLRLLEHAWRSVLDQQAGAAKDLSEILGQEHDLTVLLHVVREDPESFASARTIERFVALAEERRLRLRRRALPIGRRLFAEKPKRLTKRIETYWKAWRAHAPVHAIRPAPADATA
jgi:hypothetical protein